MCCKKQPANSGSNQWRRTKTISDVIVYIWKYAEIFLNFWLVLNILGGATVLRAAVLRYHLCQSFPRAFSFCLEYLPSGSYFTMAIEMAFLTESFCCDIYFKKSLRNRIFHELYTGTFCKMKVLITGIISFVEAFDESLQIMHCQLNIILSLFRLVPPNP